MSADKLLLEAAKGKQSKALKTLVKLKKYVKETDRLRKWELNELLDEMSETLQDSMAYLSPIVEKFAEGDKVDDRIKGKLRKKYLSENPNSF